MGTEPQRREPDRGDRTEQITRRDPGNHLGYFLALVAVADLIRHGPFGGIQPGQQLSILSGRWLLSPVLEGAQIGLQDREYSSAHPGGSGLVMPSRMA